MRNSTRFVAVVALVCFGACGPDTVEIIDIDNDEDGVLSPVDGGNDCNDENPAIYPGATERCNGEDDDCDGQIDEGYPDEDGDGVADCMETDVNVEVEVNVDGGGDGDADSDSDGDGDVDGDLPVCLPTHGQCSSWDHPVSDDGWGGMLAWSPFNGACECPYEVEDSAIVFSDGCVDFEAGARFCETFGPWNSLVEYAEDVHSRSDVVQCVPVCWAAELVYR